MIKKWLEFIKESKLIDDDVVNNIFEPFTTKYSQTPVIKEYNSSGSTPFYTIWYSGGNTDLSNIDSKIINEINRKAHYYLPGYTTVYKYEDKVSLAFGINPDLESNLCFMLYDETWMSDILNSGVKILDLDIDLSRYRDPNSFNPIIRTRLNGKKGTISIVTGEYIPDRYEAWYMDVWEDPQRYSNRILMNADLIELQLD